MRDNFLERTKRTLASRVGYHCSNPKCRRLTSGPAEAQDQTINVGVAAHITAASSGGKRYDDSLTAEQRSSVSNGIWLCQNCAKLIDSDVSRYPASLLRQWKKQAEKWAFISISSNASAGYRDTAAIPFLDESDHEFLQSLQLPAEDDIDAVTERMREAAINDLAAFRNTKEWPPHVLSLSLTIKSQDGRSIVTLDGVARGASVADGLSLVSPPGSGKSTTLIELADRILTAKQAIPVLVLLGEWSGRPEDFFPFMVRRNAFRSFRPEHFMQLAYLGRLILLLDGWNELDPNSRIRALRDIQALRRDFPVIGLVIATRSHAPGLPGTIVEIEPLSVNQQVELARAVRGNDGETLVDRARRMPGLRELISIPLYLQALLHTMPIGHFPETKEEILRMFVEQHELLPEKAEMLRKELHGTHTNMLMGLAVEATRTSTTMISETTARSTLSSVAKQLIADGQLAVSPQPPAVIDVLTNCHVLSRSSLSNGAVSFQHQQFQEWFASFEVEQQMLGSERGDLNARKQLRVEILNWPSWEEAILFACERLSRGAGCAQKAVASAIILALGIDPILAAEMIYRGTPGVWLIVNDCVTRFIERWHTPGKVGRAVRFMITSGRPEFARYVWPLVSNADSQIYLEVLSAADRFRPTVLGENLYILLAALPETVRQHVLSEIAFNGGFDGMELATKLALEDPSPDVVVTIVQTLDFRRAENQVHQILKGASDAVWQRLGRETFPEELTDSALNVRLLEARQCVADADTDSLRTIGRLVKKNTTVHGAHVAKLIQSPDFPLNRENAHHTLRSAFAVYPTQVANALLERLATGLDLPYNATDFLGDVEPVDDGPIANAAFDRETSMWNARAASSILGPKAVGRLMDHLLGLNQELAWDGSSIGEAERNEFHRLRDAISRSPQKFFFVALLLRTNTDQPSHIQCMADLIARHRREPGGDTPVPITEHRAELVTMLLRWIDVMLTSPNANRHQFADVACAAERVADPQFVSGLQKMLDRDLSDWERAREEHFKAERRGPLVPHDVSMCYALQYRRAFAAIGGIDVFNLMRRYLPGDQFGFDAACVLRDIWQRENPSPKEHRFALGSDFSEVKARRKQLQDSAQEPETCDFSEAIFAVVEELGTAENSENDQRHALRLATIGLSIPHGSKRTMFDRLLALPQPFVCKQALLRSAAIAGMILPADKLLIGTKELLAVAEKEPWRLDHNSGELMSWIELFAFSDRPGAVLEALELVPEHQRRHWHLDRLLSSLSSSPSDGVVQVLLDLKEFEPGFLDDYSWWHNLGKIGTEESSRAFLGVVCNLTAGARHGMNEWQIAKVLAEAGRRFPAFRENMIQRYESNSAGLARNILEVALAQIADEAIIIVLIRSYAAESRPYGGWIADAIRNVAVGRQPVKDWPGAFEEFSVPLISLRKKLFEMILENSPESALAEACLTAIEEKRDWHGHIEDEPRHPDIASGKPWPLIDVTPQFSD